MKKDYLPIQPDQLNLDEIERVEQQWSNAWQEMGADPAALASQVPKRDEYRLMRLYLSQIESVEPLRILDAGCGQGGWTIYLTKQGYDVYGVDIGRHVITMLEERFPECHFICADIRHLEFPDEFFDVCFSWGVFEHFEEGLGNCIAEAWRVLKPGGHLFISVPFQNWRHILRDARALHRWDIAFDRKQGYATPMGFYQWRLTPSELHRELAIAGFKVLKVKPILKLAGVSRALEFDLHIPSRSWIGRVSKYLIKPFVPGRWVSHMLMAVAQKDCKPGSA